MVQARAFPNNDVLEEKVWPRYRGKRAGKQVKERETYKRHIITTITRSRPVSRKTKPTASSSGHIPSNCKVIRLEAPSKSGSAYSFVPAFMLSNVMSVLSVSTGAQIT